MMQIRGKKRQRLGELLIENALISPSQLKDALRRQAQTGGQLGSILVEMGRISTDTLLDFLSRQIGVPSADLLKIDIPPHLLRLMSLEKIKMMKVLPIGIDDNTVTLAMVNPRDMISIRDIEFSLGKRVVPVVVPSAQMEMTIQRLESRPDTFLRSEKIEEATRSAQPQEAPTLMSLLKYLAESPVKDMLLTAGVPPSIKLRNGIKRAAMEPLTAGDCERYARELMAGKDWASFAGGYDYDLAVTYPEAGRFRVTLYRQQNTVSITLRHIADALPPLGALNLPAWLKEYVVMPHGLIIVCGPSGHGKTTTLAALVDIINSGRSCNIVTLEDPVEYLHSHKKSNVNQREIGADAQSFPEGLKHIFRQDPDVIVVGEMTDAESFDIALRAAETGHLVIMAVHANSAASSIEGIINMFPPHRQNLIRTGIAENLLFVLYQRLIASKKGETAVLSHEKLINSSRVKDLIVRGNTHQIKAGTPPGSDDYSSMEWSLAKLYLAGLIGFEEGLLSAENKQFYKDLSKTV